MQQYLNLLKHLIDNGDIQGDRTGTGTKGILGYQMRFDLSEGLPIVTTKYIHVKSVIHELLWMLSGSTNNNDLKKHGVSIWDEWALPDGDLGPIYGEQWRNWATPIINEDRSVKIKYIDQISTALRLLKDKPFSRRNIITAWNPGDLPDESMSPQENVKNGRQSLASCCSLFQLKNINGKLSGLLFQRSADVFLGVPFNILSYALLIHLFAQQADLEVGELIWTGGDTHLYLDHLEHAQLQLSRAPLPLPKLELKKAASIFDYKFEDFVITDYNHHPAIKASVSV